VSKDMRSYWIVSPNVRYNESTVSDWRRASVLGRAAFMGWKPGDNHIGDRFAHEIVPGDVILIARRHDFEPEIVGLGIVKGEAQRTIKGVKTPQSFGAVRRLSPFVPISRAPTRVPVIDAVRHTSALAKLHPSSREAHALVCNWMDRLLSRSGKRNSGKDVLARAESKDQNSKDTQIVDSPRHHQLDYIIRTKRQVKRAKKNEALLLIGYSRWLKRQGRTLATTKHGKLQCDGFEKERRNLIEAKSSTSREHIRMAVGQLLDYAFQIEKKFGKPNMAILLPREPDPNLVNWLPQRNISLIWREKTAFLDNANGQFT
jgi:hypothetical protein